LAFIDNPPKIATISGALLLGGCYSLNVIS
jgi:hypothetical protein